MRGLGVGGESHFTAMLALFTRPKFNLTIIDCETLRTAIVFISWQLIKVLCALSMTTSVEFLLQMQQMKLMFTRRHE